MKLLPSDGTNILVTAQFEIENTGSHDGAEVAQLYVHQDHSGLPRPEKELKGFKKVFLKSGEKQIVSIPLNKTAFAFYDDSKKSWVAEAGGFKISVGNSSRDLRLNGNFHLGQTLAF